MGLNVLKLIKIKHLSKYLAEAVGFEPTGRSHAQRFSRPPHSTTLPNLRLAVDSGAHAILKAAAREIPPTGCSGLFLIPQTR